MKVAASLPSASTHWSQQGSPQLPTSEEIRACVNDAWVFVKQNKDAAVYEVRAHLATLKYQATTITMALRHVRLAK